MEHPSMSRYWPAWEMGDRIVRLRHSYAPLKASKQVLGSRCGLIWSLHEQIEIWNRGAPL